MAASRLKVPELPDNLQWFNTDLPIKLEHQVGKVVVLAFWTGSYASCLHLLENFRYLEKKYSSGLTIISIHSPQYPSESKLSHVKNTIQKNKVLHPVINDANCYLLKKYGIKDKPTLILVDAEGFIIGAIRGHANLAQLESVIQKELTIAEKKNIRSYQQSSQTQACSNLTQLYYPGKILATSNKLYISDSGNNRVLEANLNGRVTRSFGGRRAGLLDGEETDALFNNPQGLEIIDDFLYVADCFNHVIRRINLHTGEVDTVMGNAVVGQADFQGYSNPADAKLNMPWGLENYQGALYISMAGSHQIWKWQLSVNRLIPFRGTGQLKSADGLDQVAAFAQPTGLSGGESALFVCDCLSSAIRKINMPDGYVSTLVGRAAEFGDMDGPNYMARLQYPLDLSYDQKRQLLWLCDSYNHKIKYLQLRNNEVQTLEIQGLNEPSGMYLYNDILWVANTNAHELVRLDLQQGSLSVVKMNFDY